MSSVSTSEETPDYSQQSPVVVGASSREVVVPEINSGLDRKCRQLVLNRLKRLDAGEVVVHEGPVATRCGVARLTDLTANVTVNDPRFYRRLALGGQLGAAKSFIQGEWTCDDLVSLIRIFARNADAPSSMERAAACMLQPIRRLYNRRRRNTVTGSRRNIADHYDLGNEFFALFLDDTMTYSSGVFEDDTATLQQSQVAKYDRIIRALNLNQHDHVIEIGTGWGGFAIHAACETGCRVTTTTISKEQHALASQRVAEAGLSDQITLLRQDYRQLEGQYDKLVSIEMIEAVGHEFLPTYFNKCSQLLKPNGLMLLQGITIADQLHETYRRSVDFIQRYIFPGGCLPSITSICQATTKASDFRLVHSEDFGLHYARTLAEWSVRFERNISAIRELGATDEFIRKWRYYFAYCEGAFLERRIGVSQLLLAKPQASGINDLAASKVI